MVEGRAQVRVHLCDAWKDSVVGLSPALAHEAESHVVPSAGAAGGAVREQRSQGTTRAGLVLP